MPRQSFFALGLIAVLIATSMNTNAAAEDKVDDPMSYFLGMSVGQKLAQDGFKADDFKMEAMIQGIRDGIDRKEAAMSDEDLQKTQSEIMELLQTRAKEMQAAAKAKGTAFLAANKAKDGVKVTKSGLQYKVIEEGSGASPVATDTVEVHYTGTLIDGTVFDSSKKRGKPATFRVNQVIPGWIEGLQLMKTGANYMFYIPSELAYGENPPPSIPPNSVLVFDVELLEIQ